MKINPLILGLSIVLAFFAGRWYSGSPSARPAYPAIAGVGFRPLPAVDKDGFNQPQPARKAPVPLDKLPVDYPGLPQSPVSLGKPEVVRNTGSFIDPDLSKLTTTYMGPDRPVRNTGEFIDPGLPTGSNR